MDSMGFGSFLGGMMSQQLQATAMESQVKAYQVLFGAEAEEKAKDRAADRKVKVDPLVDKQRKIVSDLRDAIQEASKNGHETKWLQEDLDAERSMLADLRKI